MSDYLKEKLYQAVLSLIGADEIDKRLTYAAGPILRVQDQQVPEEFREQFTSIRDRLLTTPLSSERSYSPRQISPDDANKLAEDIFSLFVRVMGGL